jgi:hypothetical protein
MLNTPHCCKVASGRQTTVRHRFDLIGWLLPTVGLALLPKCPLCLAAWVLCFTGLGISFSTAASLNSLFVIGYVAIQFYFMYRIARRVYRLF